MVFLVGYFRSYGADYITYLSLFTSLDELYFSFFEKLLIEPFWLIIGHLTTFTNFNLQICIVFFLSYTLRISSIYLFFSDNSSRLLAFLIYINFDLINRDFGQIRNGLAASMLCFIYAFLLRRRYMNISLFFVSIFHYSYVVFAIIHYCKILLSTKYFNLIFIVVSLIFSVYLIDTFSIFKDSFIFYKLYTYTNTNSHYVIFNRYPNALYVSLLLAFYYFFSKSIINSHLLLLLRLNIAFLSLFIIFRSFPVISSRLLTLFSPLFIFAIPLIVKPLLIKFKLLFTITYISIFLYLIFVLQLVNHFIKYN